jgi:hypothetical protein
MACRFRPVDRNASAVLHIEKHLFSRARGDKNSGCVSSSQALTGYYGVNPNLNVTPVAGPVPSGTSIDLTIGLPVNNPAGLKNFFLLAFSISY